ncbi:hypothetical protein CC1G_10507 [Coprinopsis cinerea okayama7|uniref:TMEM205-like domain-containing protein n=1 Tax=Coprinopsis cinerea (strain Okayama-7 / 130 / ATCC MYA-4618 / FGSC 9003) TaxID=240176 RepID=A8N186_COPC7|nr:hypothetical protein CC1G_10507 [Coprinopsis cinerea okayama7\|eukprot:XP_001828635.2 hypothetical protein CC1G_10507 [Coprinopsis cinerea okayama7\
MPHNELLTLSSLKELVNLNGLYLAGFGWLFGMSVWVTFFGGVIAFRTLPRQQFGALQHKTFPVYFTQSIALSAALLSIWISKHPSVLANLHQPRLADVAQAYALATVILAQGSNLFVVGPWTSKVMFKRHKLEKEEGVQYNDPKASAQMKALTKQFGALHGVSSLFNLLAVIALGLHGLWLGNATSLSNI